MRNLLVLGATGFVGHSVCEKLVERSGGANGFIRIATRRAARAKPLQLLPTAEVAVGDVHDDATLARMLGGVDAVINLVAVLHGSEADFERVHVRLPQRLGAACARAGVRRVIHVSALGAAPDAPSRYLRSKARGEAALAAAGLDLTVLRPSVIFGPRDRFMNLFARLQALFPIVPLAGAEARFQPVWVEDVASAVVRSLDDRSTIGLTIECCGPRQYTLKELVEAAGTWSGRPRRVVSLPAGIGRLQALTMEWLPGEPLMSRDNLDSMRVPSVASGRLPGLERLGIEPTPLEAIAPLYLGGGLSEEARLQAWRSRARRG
ncbi:MAG TPA: complex I NDUFA9 subunit family protein [Caldimonas sp.]|jgi:NADH dehydrogenase|nr:complex I NDUFA9 subunit family protein [Caldimonas sp.]HEX2542121.1 complex I NDUFA9 subunit family protein [Caldimonas sp.]